MGKIFDSIKVSEETRFEMKQAEMSNEINEWMNAYAFHKIEALWDELLKKRESTGFNPAMDKIFEKHLKELE